MNQSNKRKFYIDKTLVTLLIIFAIVSVVSIYCAQPIMQSYLRDSNLFIKQAMWYTIGFCLIVFLLFFRIDRIFTGVKIFYYILLVLLAILLFDKFIFDLPNSFIRPINGTTAWYQIKFIGSFQPSEFMKIILVIMCGITIHEHNIEKQDTSFASDIRLFIKIAVIAVPPLVMILLQPDSGIPLIIIISILSMLLISGIRKEWFYIGVSVLIIVISTFMILYYFFPTQLIDIFGSSYQLNRFYGWLDSDKYYLSHGNQLYTSQLAMGSSGLFGSGIKELLVYFPEAHTDFIFAVIGQNFGFIGTIFTVLLCTTFDLKMISIAYSYQNSAEKYAIIGIISMIVFQQLQNMGMIIGLMPITGITLPLISYGGSSMLSYMIPFAIMFYMSSTNRHKRIH